MDKNQLDRLMRTIGYQFKDIELLQLAMTHRSKGSRNYERVEFLGDSILGFIVAQWLYENYPKHGEGKLSRARSSLVRKETLAEIARSLKLSDYLILGEGELKSGGFNRDSILADSVESIIGAIYLDAGMDEARAFIFRFFANHMEGISDKTSYKDAKSQLQELMQKSGHELPVYDVVSIDGESHEQIFTVECSVSHVPFSKLASGASRRLAEQKAAEKLLQSL